MGKELSADILLTECLEEEIAELEQIVKMQSPIGSDGYMNIAFDNLWFNIRKINIGL